mmetsp:Transcript_17463/g.26514  ORF Transcript_17463/g.26514 Transcript_17463/m.26514 type:complete len:214 (-) Transcript_17463:176-817(-)|eukprot:CAMPEP_0178922602 /NCGR_PEP_ID=MMETSP0786-20121207/16249_1 /TAXON_ID=186022 /ORGANISM="Thalassionema frauenfeldii, Strain CCMP 1798" /LENGTH=213 /DNA_ID=CAMNT_0020596993 /DNA_START=241 /DNA_END=882 /DNA_ORIENTATION=+
MIFKSCDFLLFLIGISFRWHECVYALTVTDTPPLLDVPTYSLATKDGERTGMNILTYATPVSVQPDRIWSIGLYKGTVAHEQFSKTGKGVLQMLKPQHAKLVKLLGGSSGRDVDKREECAKLGFPWITTADDTKNKRGEQMPELLPDCVYYLELSQVGLLVDCGSHDVAICKVERMYVPSEQESDTDDDESYYLNTRSLRNLGIITKQGRAAE